MSLYQSEDALKLLLAAHIAHMFVCLTVLVPSDSLVSLARALIGFAPHGSPSIDRASSLPNVNQAF